MIIDLKVTNKFYLGGKFPNIKAENYKNQQYIKSKKSMIHKTTMTLDMRM